MTVIGFREGDEHATRIDLAPGVSVRVVTIPTLVILRVVAYYDRRKIDDLADVLFILENYSRYELETGFSTNWPSFSQGVICRSSRLAPFCWGAMLLLNVARRIALK
jgi:predicted nucleotidyltransferase